MEKDVFWLEIAMDDIMAMHVLHCSAHLPHPFLNYPLLYLAHIFQILIEIAAEARLKYQICAVLIYKKVIEAHHMRM